MERLEKDKKTTLDSFYQTYAQASSLSGIHKLYKASKSKDKNITLKDVQNYLKSKDSYTLHRVTKKKFDRRVMLAPKPGVIISCDLADMRELSKYNNGVKYLLICIDIFSRFAKVISLKQKNAAALLNPMKIILSSKGFQNVSRIHTDKGGEFYNKILLNYLKSKNIRLYSVSSYEIKASIAERFIRTLKNKIYRYLTNENTLKYVNVLDKLVQSYNSSNHRSLGKHLTPEKVHNNRNEEDIKKLFYFMYNKGIPKRKSISSKLDVGSNVRISDKLRSSKFHRGYKKQNTLEIFTVRKIDDTQHPPIYFLKDLNEEEIEGVFYREELVPTTLPSVFPIKILGKKKIKNKLHYKVSWIGYPDSFHSFVPVKDVKRINKK